MKTFEEVLFPAAGLRLQVDSVLYEKSDGMQKILVFENPIFGRVLALDGVVQTTERDEFVYHEMIAHVPVLGHGAARRVLIIGGGDGGVLEEVLKHGTVERATLVEIDPDVIAASREFLPSIGKDAFADPRAELLVMDAVEHVRDSERQYDVIIVDSTDPQGPSEALFSASFYADCRRRLAPGGIIVTQSGVSFLQPEVLRATTRHLRESFREVTAFSAAVPSYFGGLLMLGWASDDAAPRAAGLDLIRARYAASGIATRYYTPEIHLASFALPAFARELIAPSGAEPR